MTKRVAKAVGLVCALGLVAIVALPQDAGAIPIPRPQASVIAGLVSDGDGDPVAGIEVTLVSGFGSTQTTTTDSDGEFVFDDLTPGRYKVSVCDGADAIRVGLGGPDIFVFLTASCAD